MIKHFFSTAQISKSIVPGVAKSLREASRLDTIAKLELDSSESFVCKNMMCEHLGNSCGKTWPLLYCNTCNTILYCSWLSYIRPATFDTNLYFIDALISCCVVFRCSLFYLLQLVSTVCRLALWLTQNQRKLTTLTSLNLSNNGLTKLPDGVFELPNLEHLDLSNNNLTTINVEQIVQLSSLNTLDLRGNKDLFDVEHDILMKHCKVMV